MLRIDAGKVWLRGPFELEKDQTLSKMYIWLWQSDGDGTGAAATAVLDEADFDSAAAQNVGGAEWQATAQPEHGEFRAGPATGMALAILRRADGSTTPYWWSDSNIRLKEGPTDGSAPSTDVTAQLAEAFQAVADTLKIPSAVFKTGVPKDALELDNTLSWKTATGNAATMLEELQPNILRPHVREHLSVLLLRFGDRVEGRTFLRELAVLVKSARRHLQEVEDFKTMGKPGTSYVGVGLTHAGYEALGVDARRIPSDASFTRGMKDPDSRDKLHDPPPSTWEPPYREEIHAVVLVGDATDGGMAATRDEVLDRLTGSITVLGEETGLGQHNGSGAPIEHFGYVDGLSQPLFLDEDIRAARDRTPGAIAWDPEFHLDRVLVKDLAAPDPDVHCGSYFVFRKLEQNVRRFKQAEDDLAQALGLIGGDRDRAGAMLVGRFEDGTPLTVQQAPGAPLAVANNFDYGADAGGRRCPLQAHIRKVNPRGSGGIEPLTAERVHVMARRGQTYGQRTDDLDADLPPSSRPTGGVGLLFMAFNADLGRQFDFVQERWVNDPGFPRLGGGAEPGRDPVIGRGARKGETYFPIWGAAAAVTTAASPQAVTLKGGEYFFMPSLAFLRDL
ncbi:Dyp-type peroxidase [Geodermatophilus sp. URMC 65]